MGKKINPKIHRMGIVRTWPSSWFSVGNRYIQNVRQDLQIRRYITKKLIEAGVDRVEIGRNNDKIMIDIFTAKPGIVIGRGGDGIEKLKKDIHLRFLSRPAGIRPGQININIKEVDRPNLSANIVMQSMIVDIEKRMAFRRVMKQAINRVERAGALGVKVRVGGRLNGAEIARTEKLVSGKVPLQTLRADIDYSRGTAHTTYGSIGIKVWIYKGDVFDKNKKEIKGDIIGKSEK